LAVSEDNTPNGEEVMGNGIYNAVSGSLAQMRHLDVLSNNMAHVGVEGFKADILSFEQELQDAGSGRHTVDTPRSKIRMTQGAMRSTDNPLDVALSGDGFLVVEGENGERLTRAGRMVIGADRILRDIGGHAMVGEAGHISVPEPTQLEAGGPISIDKMGNVVMGKIPLGQLKVVAADTDTLKKDGLNLFRSSVPVNELLRPEKTQMMQGQLELSNVNPVHIMIQIVSVQRNYEALQQVVKTYREAD
jgi:flagellar basal-body rod protein FlgF